MTQNCNATGCVLEPVGTRRFTYHTTHTRGDVTRDGYFNGLRTTLRTGDVIDVPFVNLLPHPQPCVVG